MTVQRAAAGVGAFLVLVIGTSVCVVAAGALAGVTGSAPFGVVLKSVLVLVLLVSTLGSFIRWGHGGSLALWLGVALLAYVATPSSWAASNRWREGAIWNRLPINAAMYRFENA